MSEFGVERSETNESEDPTADYFLQCQCCLQMTDVLVWHHDHLAERLVGLWRRVCRDRGMCAPCTESHRNRIVNDAAGARSHGKLVAAQAFTHLMRFAEPIETCEKCNAVDGYMKGKIVGGGPRISELSTRLGFSATCAEIADCVTGPRGQSRGHMNDAAVAEYRRIVLADRWAWRVGQARAIMTVIARELPKASSCEACRRIQD